jgi:hypothetical protein
MFLGSVFTVCATCNVISHVKYVLFFYISAFRSLCTVRNMAVFCSSLILCFPGLLLSYSLSVVIIIITTTMLFCRRRRCRLWLRASSMNDDPHRSGFKFQTAVLPVLFVMFQV